MFFIKTSDENFNKILKDNQKELTELLEKNPEKFFELEIFENCCANSLTNKIDSLIKLFPNIKNINPKQVFKGLINLCMFNNKYQLDKIGVQTFYHKKY